MYLGTYDGITKQSVEENYEKLHTSECVTRKMTKEEWLRYFGKGKKKMAGKPKISREKLLELCIEHGTDWRAAKIIGDMAGLKPQTIVSNIKNWGIEEKMAEKKEPIEATHTLPLNEHFKDLAHAVNKAPDEAERSDSKITIKKETKYIEKAINPVFKVSTDDAVSRLVYAEYKVGNILVGFSYDEELIGLDQAEGISFDEILHITDLIRDKIKEHYKCL